MSVTASAPGGSTVSPAAAAASRSGRATVRGRLASSRVLRRLAGFRPLSARRAVARSDPAAPRQSWMTCGVVLVRHDLLADNIWFESLVPRSRRLRPTCAFLVECCVGDVAAILDERLKIRFVGGFTGSQYRRDSGCEALHPHLMVVVVVVHGFSVEYRRAEA